MFNKTTWYWIAGTLAVLLLAIFPLWFGITFIDGENSSFMQDSYATMPMDASTKEVSLGLNRMMAPSPGGEMLYDEATAQTVDEKKIKSGTLDMVVDQVDETVGQIQQLTLEQQGTVQNVWIYEQPDGTKTGSVTIKVPFAKFEQIITDIKQLARVVEQETISTDDVTEQYIDLSARLKNAKTQEGRYLEILNSAKNVEEILQIEQALGNIRSQIESLIGRIQYLDSMTDYSTINVNLNEEPTIKIGGKDFRPGTTIQTAAQAVVEIAQWLVIAIIWIVIVGVGVGVPLLLIGWLGWKLVKKVKR